MVSTRNNRYRLLIVLPILCALLFSYLFFIKLPLYDYWDVINESFFLKGSGFKAHLAFYWKPFVDQRMVFPKAFIDSLAILTQNTHYALEIGFGFLARLFSLFLIWRIIGKTDLREKAKTLLLLVCAFGLFWPLNQFIFHHHWYSTTYAWVFTPGVIGLWFLVHFWGRWAGLAAALAACLVSTFSHGMGLLLFLSISIVLSFQPVWSWKQKGLWWIFFIGAFLLFTIGLPSRESMGAPPLVNSLLAPWKFLSFFFQALAPHFRFLLHNPGLKTIAGMVLFAPLLPSVFALYRKGMIFSKDTFLWLTLSLWCLAMAGTSSLSRSSGLAQPNVAYYALTVCFLISIIAIWILAREKVSLFKWEKHGGFFVLSKYGFYALLILCFLIGSVEGIRGAERGHENVEYAIRCLKYYPMVDFSLFRNTVFPADQEQRLKKTLNILGRNNALPCGIDSTPFTVPVPARFKVVYAYDLEIQALSGRSFQFEVTGPDPYAVFQSSRKIPSSHVFSFGIDTPEGTEGQVFWYDGVQWNEKNSLTFKSKGTLDKKISGFFLGKKNAPLVRKTKTFRIDVMNKGIPGIKGSIQAITFWTR